MQLMGIQDKAWGYENIFATTDSYCGKILHFNKIGSKFSMHFHTKKDESWIVIKGSFILRKIDTLNAAMMEEVLKVGDRVRNKPNEPHQLIALEDDSEIIEVSSEDSVEDNFRVMPGDSQNG